MTIYGYKMIDYQFPLLKIKLHVGSGTYIRSIAHRVGTQIGGDAILTSLKRTEIGEYSLDQLYQKTVHTAIWDDLDVNYIKLEDHHERIGDNRIEDIENK